MRQMERRKAKKLQKIGISCIEEKMYCCLFQDSKQFVGEIVRHGIFTWWNSGNCGVSDSWLR